MREDAEPCGEFWTDHKGAAWPITRSLRRLKFRYPAHAALRAYVFHRDGYRCVKCNVTAVDVPNDYTGRWALATTGRHRDGSQALLVVDHVVTLKAGGKNEVENLQSLCELCNLRKMSEDNAASAVYRRNSDG